MQTCGADMPTKNGAFELFADEEDSIADLMDINEGKKYRLNVSKLSEALF